MIKITNTHPIPKGQAQKKRRPGRKSERQEAISQLQVKDSFFLKTSISSVSTLIWWAKARFPGREFTSETENDGVRIWRTV